MIWWCHSKSLSRLQPARPRRTSRARHGARDHKYHALVSALSLCACSLLCWRRSSTMRSLLCLLALLPFVLGNLSSRYAFTTTLYNGGEDTYVLHWNFSTAERTIAFAVNVSTTGWVGFGLSPDGGMVNSDVVMGWVRSGQTYFHVSSFSSKILGNCR